MFHFDKWKKQRKQIGAYLNENATKEEFDVFIKNQNKKSIEWRNKIDYI